MKMMKFLTGTISVAAMAVGLAAGQASAAGKLNFYCSAQEEWCQVMAKEFEKASGISVSMSRKSSGETFAQVKAESRNPKGDV